MTSNLDTFKSRRTMTVSGKTYAYFGPAIVELCMRIALTAVLTGASLFVILSKTYDPGAQYWAFGVIAWLSWHWFGPQGNHPPGP